MSEFTLESWKEKIGENLRGVKEGINSTAAGSVYALLAGSALLPVYQTMLSDPAAAHALLGNQGGNLLANVIQKWKDKADPHAAAEAVHVAMLDDPHLLSQLDLILEKLNVIEQARDLLPPVDQQAFRDILRAELQQLGNGQAPYFQAVLSGANHAAEHRYLRALTRRCLDLPLSALGHDRAVADKLRLDRVYIDLDTTTGLALPENTSGEQKRNSPSNPEESKPLSALAAARTNPHLVLLGDPGGGKTTFVRRLGWPPPGWGKVKSMSHKEMVIFTRTYDLLTWLVPITDNFPRAKRHSVTKRMLDAISLKIKFVHPFLIVGNVVDLRRLRSRWLRASPPSCPSPVKGEET